MPYILLFFYFFFLFIFCFFLFYPPPIACVYYSYTYIEYYVSASSYIGLVYGSISLVAALLICIGLERLPRPNGHKHKTPTPTTHWSLVYSWPLNTLSF